MEESWENVSVHWQQSKFPIVSDLLHQVDASVKPGIPESLSFNVNYMYQCIKCIAYYVDCIHIDFW